MNINLILLSIISMLNISSSCDKNAGSAEHSGQVLLVGSTPCSLELKSILGIKISDSIDFMKWNLKLNSASGNDQTFILDIHYGLSKPNTNGFMEDGFKKQYHGTYSIISQGAGNFIGQIYQFKSKDFGSNLNMLKLDQNIFHFLNAYNQLVVGNGGWNYILSNKQSEINSKDELTMIGLKSEIPAMKNKSLTYDGRTPCQEIAITNKLEVSESCFKLKWRLILNRDSINFQPTSYSISMTNLRKEPRKGSWKITQLNPDKAGPIVYTLDPDQPDKSIQLLTFDNQVLFFINKNNQFYSGNEDFSYALNKK